MILELGPAADITISVQSLVLGLLKPGYSPAPDALSGGSMAFMIISTILWTLLCVMMAQKRGRNLLIWGWLGFLLGPFAAILLMVLPATPAAKKPQNDTNDA